MSTILDAARIAAGLNVLVLVALASLLIRNYRRISSRQTLGMALFAGLLLAENALALYYYTLADIPLSAPAVRAMMYLQVLEAGAVLVVAWVFWE